jgi:uncharacterized protein DUF6527
MKLRDLDAKFVHSTAQGWRDVDTFAEADGVLFDCPECGGHKVIVFSTDAPVELAAAPNGKRWTLSGTSLDDLTIIPSIQLTSGCMWHGIVQKGEVLS